MKASLEAQLARTVLEELVRQNPEHTLALNNLASLLEDEDPDRALEYAERAYALAPEAPFAKDTLGMVLLKQGRQEESMRLLRQASKKAPQVPLFRYHLAQALADSGEHAEARAILKDLLQDPRFTKREEAQALLSNL